MERPDRPTRRAAVPVRQVDDDQCSGRASRRAMLRYLGVGGATMAVAGTGMASYRVFDNGVLDAGSGSPYEPWSHWRDDPGPLGMIGAAILAANPHNAQPWTFRADPTRIDVFADPTRRVGALDPFAREQHIGLGCALENLVLAAAARGFTSRVSLLPSPGDPIHVAVVDLAPGPMTSSPLHEAIGTATATGAPTLPTRFPPGNSTASPASAPGSTGRRCAGSPPARRRRPWLR